MRLPLVATLLLAAPLRSQAPVQSSADSAFARGEYAAALRLYESILPGAPANLTAHIRAGFAALSLNEVARARTWLAHVIAASPTNGAPVAHGGMAMVHARSGDRAAAIASLEKAVAAGYANTDAIDGERAFDPMRKDVRFAAARTRAELNAFPCLGDSASRSFDFWIGDWDVYVTGTPQRVGRNTIESVSGGCALLENWTALTPTLGGPSNGKSLNFLDPATREWKQVWMGSGRGQTNYLQGAYRDGAMHFTYARTDQQGNKLTGRFRFFNLGPNRVRQFQEASRDGGQTYQPVYDFTYIRRGSGEPPVSRE